MTDENLAERIARLPNSAFGPGGSRASGDARHRHPASSARALAGISSVRGDHGLVAVIFAAAGPTVVAAPVPATVLRHGSSRPPPARRSHRPRRPAPDPNAPVVPTPGLPTAPGSAAARPVPRPQPLREPVRPGELPRPAPSAGGGPADRGTARFEPTSSSRARAPAGHDPTATAAPPPPPPVTGGS